MQTSIISKYEQTIYSEFSSKHINRIPSDMACWMIYRIRMTWREIEEKRIRFLKQLFNDFSEPYLLFDGFDNPGALEGDWIEVATCEWIIPKDVNVKSLYKILYVGDWLIYKTKRDRIRSFKGYNLENHNSMAQLIQEYPLIFLLKSYHDNDPWFLGLNQREISS